MSDEYVVVVSDAADLPELGDRAVSADDFLLPGTDLPAAAVINLCRSYRYRSKGYYVSLIAAARGQRVLPAVETLEELGEPFGLFRVLREAGVPTIEVSEIRGWRRQTAARVGADDAAVDAPPAGHGRGVAARRGNGWTETAEAMVILGSCERPEFREAASAAYRAWPIPMLKLSFVRKEEEWWVAGAEPVPLQRLAPGDRAALVQALAEGRGASLLDTPRPPETKRASIAVLFDEGEPFNPSSPETIRHLERVAAGMNVYVHRLGLDEIDRLPEYDALFIRALTGVREPAFEFALRAEMLDMPVIDDPQSIIRCSNKVFLDELLRREGISTPRTLIVTARTPWSEVATLGTPVVVKLPDGSFSAAVHKISNEEEYAKVAGEMFRRSPLLIAQEFLRTDFDWRVVLLGGEVLFTARYFMAEGHWQIRSAEGAAERFGPVEAVPRNRAPAEVTDLAGRAAGLIGQGLYGVDIKETPSGPVVIEINDNPNLDLGEDDTADGDAIYRDIVEYFLRRVEETPAEVERPRRRTGRRAEKPHYRPFSVAGMELEYAVVDADLEPASLVESAFRVIAGRPTSDVELGRVAFSNEIADHVFEVKTTRPTRSLREAEDLLVEGVRGFSRVLADRFAARLLPTGMHPWLDPRRAKLWKRSGGKIYDAYSRVFDVRTHGWMNVHAAHLNLPIGRGPEAVAMLNASALLIPYLPALAASSPAFDGELHDPVDNRMEWIFRHQAAIPASQGEILPEYLESLTDYRRNILQPMYRALDPHPGTEALRQDFFNARGAVLKLSRRALEVRVLDMQECVRADVAIAVFVRAVIRYYTQKLISGSLPLPPRQILLGDFRASIRCGSRARVVAPHLGDPLDRDGEGRASVRDCLHRLLAIAERTVRKDEEEYLPVVASIIEAGPISEQIRATLLPHRDDPAAMRGAMRSVYGELAECLVDNTLWKGRRA